jgi:integrase
MGRDGRADCDHDWRYRALVLLATFASLRWGEATALRRCDLDLTAGIVSVRAAYAERSTGELVLGPPKSRAARRIVGIPATIIPAVREHLALFVGTEAEALIFPVPRAARCGAATSTSCRLGRTPSGRSAPKACTFMISDIPGTTSPQLAARASRI